MKNKKTQILNTSEIDQKIRRMAYQIYENHAGENKVILAGIADNGYIFAEKLKGFLDQITPMEIVLCEVQIDKANPLGTVSTSIPETQYKDQIIVLVDDVLNSGSTLIYGVKHFLDVELKELNTAVLIDRSHKKFPVKVDFKGLSLSTSLSEHVEVVFEKDNQKAILY